MLKVENKPLRSHSPKQEKKARKHQRQLRAKNPPQHREAKNREAKNREAKRVNNKLIDIRERHVLQI